MRISETAVHKHRTPAQREELLPDYRRSGLTQRVCSERAGIALSTLQLWLRKAACAPQFIALAAVSSPSGPTARYRLHLGGGKVLEIGAGFRAEELATLLALLRPL
jgi:hypothetical protein